MKRKFIISFSICCWDLPKWNQTWSANMDSQQFARMKPLNWNCAVCITELILWLGFLEDSLRMDRYNCSWGCGHRKKLMRCRKWFCCSEWEPSFHYRIVHSIATRNLRFESRLRKKKLQRELPNDVLLRSLNLSFYVIFIPIQGL